MISRPPGADMEPLTIAFTPTIIVSQRAGGISRYFSSLIEELALLGVHATVPGLLHQNEYLSRASFRATSAYYAPLTALRLATVAATAHRVTLRWSRAMRKAQCVHETYYHIPPLLKSQRCVVTVYDMIHEMFPEQMVAGDTTSARKAQAVERADRPHGLTLVLRVCGGGHQTLNRSRHGEAQKVGKDDGVHHPALRSRLLVR